MSVRPDAAQPASPLARSANASGTANRAADIAHYQRLLVASRKWNVSNGSMAALVSLGVAVEGHNSTDT